MHKVVTLALAPVGGWGPGKGNPLTVEALVQEAVDCAELGVSMIHFHSRDSLGNLSADTSHFEETARFIAKETDLLIEASTGGLSELDDEERVRPASAPQARLGSLNLGSLNFGDAVYQNSLPSIRLWIERLKLWGVHPSLEIFDTGNLETARVLIEKGLLLPPYNFSLIFNCRWGMVWSSQLLDYLLSRLPDGSNWGTIFVGSNGFESHLQAAERGASFIRAGFEDSNRIRDRETHSNREMIEILIKELRERDFQIRTPMETAALLLP